MSWKNIEINNLEIYKQIVKHINDWIWIWDKNNKTIYVNEIFCNLSWYSVEEIIKKDYSLLFENKDIEDIKLEEEKSIKYEEKLKTKKWKRIPVLCSWSLTINSWKVLIVSDLSELNSLKQAEKDLIKINKTKDEFISIVWHELRTPLTSIRWYLSMFLDWDMWDINEKMKRPLIHIYDSSVRLISIVNDVLSISKIESWKMEYHIEKVEILKVIESVRKDIEIEAKIKNINFNVIFDKNLEKEKINVDKDKLKQVFLNLLTNALKFTKDWWNIDLKATKIKDSVKFEVIDNWIWIPDDKLNMLFKKFSQVESSLQRHNTSWLWLWLVISKNILKKFNSKIELISKQWEWSNFFFELELIKD